MLDVIEVFDEAKNVDFLEFTNCEGLGAELPVFSLKEPTTAEWNRKAKIQNTKMFIRIMKRNPRSYQEVLEWIHSPKKEENHIAGNDMAFV